MVSVRKDKRIFQQNDGEISESEPIFLIAPATYNKKVKIHDWQFNELIEPRDYTNFFPPEGSLHLGSYKRFGDYDSPKLISETHSMLQQIFTERKCSEPKGRLSNILSEALKETSAPKVGDIITFGDKSIDYKTTTKIDFQMIYSPKATSTSPKELPKLLYHRTLGYSSEDLGKRNGINTFLDDNLEIYNKIAALKAQRYKSYDPIQKCYTDPYKYLK